MSTPGRDALELATALVNELNALLESDATELPSVKIRTVEAHEGDFVRLASWLYAFRRESARHALDFLVTQVVRSAPEERARQIGALRTYFQHHLPESSSSTSPRQAAERHIAVLSGNSAGDPIDWESALAGLEGLTVSLLQDYAEMVAELARRDADDDSDLRSAWSLHRSRTVTAETVDPVIRRLADEIGSDALDVPTFRNRHAARWESELRSTTFRTDPSAYLEQIVLRDMLSLMRHAPMPLTGVDVMDAFGIAPGPLVGDALLAAQRAWDDAEALLSKAELIARVADALQLTPIQMEE